MLKSAVEYDGVVRDLVRIAVAVQVDQVDVGFRRTGIEAAPERAEAERHALLLVARAPQERDARALPGAHERRDVASQARRLPLSRRHELPVARADPQRRAALEPVPVGERLRLPVVRNLDVVGRLLRRRRRDARRRRQLELIPREVAVPRQVGPVAVETLERRRAVRRPVEVVAIDDRHRVLDPVQVEGGALGGRQRGRLGRHALARRPLSRRARRPAARAVDRHAAVLRKAQRVEVHRPGARAGVVRRHRHAGLLTRRRIDVAVRRIDVEDLRRPVEHRLLDSVRVGERCRDPVPAMDVEEQPLAGDNRDIH